MNFLKKKERTIMQKIAIKFRDYYIGDLTFENNNYVYKTNDVGVDMAITEGGVPLFLYDVNNSFVSPELPNGLKNLIPNPEHQLYKDLKLGECANDFERLYVLSGENLADDGLYVERK